MPKRTKSSRRWLESAGSEIIAASGDGSWQWTFCPWTPLPASSSYRETSPATRCCSNCSTCWGRRPQLVMSDIAPNMSGMAEVDPDRSMHLVELALDFAKRTLLPGGDFLVKVFQGRDFQPLMQQLRSSFETIRIRKPGGLPPAKPGALPTRPPLQAAEPGPNLDQEALTAAGIRLWPPVADGIEPGAASGRICMDESPSGSGFASHGCSSVDRTLPMLRFVSRRTIPDRRFLAAVHATKDFPRTGA